MGGGAGQHLRLRQLLTVVTGAAEVMPHVEDCEAVAAINVDKNLLISDVSVARLLQ